MLAYALYMLCGKHTIYFLPFSESQVNAIRDTTLYNKHCAFVCEKLIHLAKLHKSRASLIKCTLPRCEKVALTQHHSLHIRHNNQVLLPLHCCKIGLTSRTASATFRGVTVLDHIHIFFAKCGFKWNSTQWPSSDARPTTILPFGVCVFEFAVNATLDTWPFGFDDIGLASTWTNECCHQQRSSVEKEHPAEAHTKWSTSPPATENPTPWWLERGTWNDLCMYIPIFIIIIGISLPIINVLCVYVLGFWDRW